MATSSDKKTPVKPAATKPAAAATAVKLEPERSNFKQLILGNLNFFGNMPDLGLKAVKPMTGNTRYEQLKCIGLNPNAGQLEAVVDIKQHFGYEGNACTNGSHEYVRFYVEHAGVCTTSDQCRSPRLISRGRFRSATPSLRASTNCENSVPIRICSKSEEFFPGTGSRRPISRTGYRPGATS